jgi:hypothetical protein
MSINITLSEAGLVGTARLPTASARASETLASAGTASAALGRANEIWTIVAEVDVWVEFGANPNGAGAGRWRMRSGHVRQFTVTAPGERVAFQTV